MAVKAVHLCQKLIQRLLTLVIAAVTGITALSDSINLVDKNNAGRVLFRLLKQVADTGRSHAHEHFYKIRTGQGKEGHMGLPCHRFGKQRLSGTRRTYQQGSFGKLGSDLRVFAGIMKEIYHLLKRFLGFLLAGHVLEGHSGILLDVDLGLTLAHIHAHHAAATAHSAHQQGKGSPEQQYRKQEIHNR